MCLYVPEPWNDVSHHQQSRAEHEAENLLDEKEKTKPVLDLVFQFLQLNVEHRPAFTHVAEHIGAGSEQFDSPEDSNNTRDEMIDSAQLVYTSLHVLEFCK